VEIFQRSRVLRQNAQTGLIDRLALTGRQGGQRLIAPNDRIDLIGRIDQLGGRSQTVRPVAISQVAARSQMASDARIVQPEDQGQIALNDQIVLTGQSALLRDQIVLIDLLKTASPEIPDVTSTKALETMLIAKTIEAAKALVMVLAAKIIEVAKALRMVQSAKITKVVKITRNSLTVPLNSRAATLLFARRNLTGKSVRRNRLSAHLAIVTAIANQWVLRPTMNIW